MRYISEVVRDLKRIRDNFDLAPVHAEAVDDAIELLPEMHRLLLVMRPYARTKSILAFLEEVAP